MTTEREAPTLRPGAPVLLLVMLMAAISAVAWFRLPDRVPVHYGFDLEPDRFGHKAELVLAVPAVLVVIGLLIPWFARFDARRDEPGFAAAVAWMRIAIMACFAVLHAAILVVTLRGSGPWLVAVVVPLLAIVLLAIVPRVLTSRDGRP